MQNTNRLPAGLVSYARGAQTLDVPVRKEPVEYSCHLLQFKAKVDSNQLFSLLIYFYARLECIAS